MRDTNYTTPDIRDPNMNTHSSCEIPSSRCPGAFDFERLEAFVAAREALSRGDQLARRLPRGYATLVDPLRRALLSTYLGIAEAASRTGNDRLARFRCARGECAEAAAALDAVALLGLAPAAEVAAIVTLLRRTAAMLTRLAHLRQHDIALGLTPPHPFASRGNVGLGMP